MEGLGRGHRGRSQGSGHGGVAGSDLRVSTQTDGQERPLHSLALPQHGPDFRLQAPFILQLGAQASGHGLKAARGGAESHSNGRGQRAACQSLSPREQAPVGSSRMGGWFPQWAAPQSSRPLRVWGWEAPGTLGE